MDGLSWTDPATGLAERAVQGARAEIGLNGIKGADGQALAALDAAVIDLSREPAQEAGQRQQRAAGTDGSAPEPRSEQAEEKHSGEQHQGQPHRRAERFHHAPVLEEAELQVPGAEKQAARQNRDGGDVAGEENPAKRRHQHGGKEVEAYVGPTPDRLRLKPTDALPDERVERVDAGSQRTEVPAESARKQQPGRQNAGHADQGDVPAARGEGAGQADERVDPQERLHRQPLLVR